MPGSFRIMFSRLICVVACVPSWRWPCRQLAYLLSGRPQSSALCPTPAFFQASSHSRWIYRNLFSCSGLLGTRLFLCCHTLAFSPSILGLTVTLPGSGKSSALPRPQFPYLQNEQVGLNHLEPCPPQNQSLQF